MIRRRTLKQGNRKIILSKLSGTQALDRTWKELDRAIPKSLNKKTPIKGTAHREINEDVYVRVWAWLYRFNKRHTEVNALSALRSLVKLLWADHIQR